MVRLIKKKKKIIFGTERQNNLSPMYTLYTALLAHLLDSNWRGAMNVLIF